MTSPKIQKDIVSACAQETVKAIINDLDENYFGILVDESKDISYHEQMALALRPSKIRGQGYDGASNMQGKMNGLKSLILQETPSAHWFHCFAHQLQLTVVAVAKKHKEVKTFFAIVANVLNVIGISFKRRDKLRDHQAELLEQLLESGEVQSGKGLNQERGLQRPGDTRWGSHCKTLDNFVVLFASIVHVLGVIEYEGSEANDRLQAEAFLSKINSFKFVFMLHLMLKVLLMSNELSKALQKKEQDIVNAMIFLNLTKDRLQ
nr:zinc finger MYM-type protein 1-like [Nicotiana tomentosiformis]